RFLAMALLALFALTLLLPGVAQWLSRPLVALGARINAASDAGTGAGHPLLPSLALGVATGLLWAPCAGPLLGLILTGAALQGPNAGSSLLLLAYAAGAATSLALGLLAGGRVHAALRRSLVAGEWARRGMGVAVLAGVALIATGLDTGLLTRLSFGSTARIEQALIDAFRAPAGGGGGMDAAAATLPASSAPAALAAAGPLTVRSERLLPPLSGAVEWINSPALQAGDLRGKVVLVDFWTYSCINCLRTLPYIRAWADKYRDAGLVVVGVHSPEFAFEKDPAHVRRAVKDLQLTYPVAVDSQHSIWRAFRNQYWPALYFVDAQGRVRHHVFGEGGYEASEKMIQQLLAETGKASGNGALVSVTGEGTQAAPGDAAQSGETYIGFARAENFASPGGIDAGKVRSYAPPASLRLNHWSLAGDWKIEAERGIAARPATRLAYRFKARDLHLVLGREAGGAPVRFRILVDGKPPLSGHGTDVDAQGNGAIDAHRLYQLVRLTSSADDHLFEIEFLDAGAHVYAFTFG
ncbi:MAG: cytochrome c biosis protein DipZ, partial [Polaromonas sp.]|nr:cytochrome c biosis protein DipZ [Polaromonas sp.]